MITPAFEITQDSNFLYITIKAPYSKVSEVDIYVDKEDFKFYAKPYFLRLRLPASLVEDDRSSCTYNVEKGEYKLKIGKEESGAHFEDLDMLTKLLSPTGGRKVKQPLIEVIDDECNDEENDGEEEFQWYFPQTYELETATNGTMGCGYGFANQKSSVFGKLQKDIHDVLQVGNLEHSTAEGRAKEMQMHENENFDPDHYLADFFENEDAERLRKLQPPWKSIDCTGEFTDEEKFTLKNFPGVEYLLGKSQLQGAYLGLVDILFSYAYNWRCTEGDYSVESPWNIRTLSATLAWCVSFSDIRQTALSSYRRALIFPLYRNWKLAKACHRDVVLILTKGKKYILKCLLEIHELFAKSDPYYILNDLYIRDYCIWIQKSSGNVLESLAKSLKELKFEKNDLGLSIAEFEEAGQLALKEEQGGLLSESDSTTSELTAKIQELKV